MGMYVGYHRRGPVLERAGDDFSDSSRYSDLPGSIRAQEDCRDCVSDRRTLVARRKLRARPTSCQRFELSRNFTGNHLKMIKKTQSKTSSEESAKIELTPLFT